MSWFLVNTRQRTYSPLRNTCRDYWINTLSGLSGTGRRDSRHGRPGRCTVETRGENRIRELSYVGAFSSDKIAQILIGLNNPCVKKHRSVWPWCVGSMAKRDSASEWMIRPKIFSSSVCDVTTRAKPHGTQVHPLSNATTMLLHWSTEMLRRDITHVPSSRWA